MSGLVSLDRPFAGASGSVVPPLVLEAGVFDCVAVSGHVGELQLVESRAALALSLLVEPVLLSQVGRVVQDEVVLVEGELALVVTLARVLLDLKLSALQTRLVKGWLRLLQVHALPFGIKRYLFKLKLTNILFILLNYNFSILTLFNSWLHVAQAAKQVKQVHFLHASVEFLKLALFVLRRLPGDSPVGG